MLPVSLPVIGSDGSVTLPPEAWDGVQALDGRFVSLDLETTPKVPGEFPQIVLASVADETGAAAIFGSRVLGGEVKYKYAHAYLGVRVLTAITNLRGALSNGR